jgi:hypothetical protein
MRELTPAELSFISGAYDNNEDIVVVGTPYPPPYYPPPYFYPYNPPYYPPYYPGGGGYYPPPPPPPPPTDDYCQDQEAMQGADEIEAQSNDNSKEYGSIVYKHPDGRVLHSPPLGGTGDTIDLSVFTNWMTQNGVSWSQVMGMVHNHPSNVYGTSQTEADVNRYPSSGDWGFAQYAMNNGAQASFSLYINDTSGNLREFAWSDRTQYQNLTQQQMDDGQNLPPETRACGS